MSWTYEDWSALGSVLSGAGTVLGAITVLIAAWIGSKTFESWRQQRLLERDSEQAERILTAAYKVRDALAIVRNVCETPHEQARAQASLKENGTWDRIAEDERTFFERTQLHYNRIHAARNDRLALEECLPMARALFGKELESAIKCLNLQFGRVQAAVNMRHQARGNLNASTQIKIDSAIFAGSEENEMDQTIAEQVDLIERICTPALRLEVRPRRDE